MPIVAVTMSLPAARKQAEAAASGTVGPEPAPPPRRRAKAGYLRLLPGMRWLLVFFLVPTIQLAATSLYDPNGTLDTGYAMTWSFSNYWHALTTNSRPSYAMCRMLVCQMSRSSTVGAHQMSRPFAYIAVRSSGM